MSEEFSRLVEPGRVHRRVYTDPAVFAEERRRIFRRVWLWLGHESQVRVPGDFFTASLAGDRVIVARHSDGRVHAFHNRCSHRGAEVCLAASGKARNFVCPYHAWTYRTDGSSPRFRWKAATRIGRGCPASSRSRASPAIAASCSAAMPGRARILETFLGPEVRAALDNLVDRAPDGEVELAGGKTVQRYRGNWKLQLENSIDLLHPRILHRSAIDAADRVDHGGRPPSIEWDIVKSNGLTLREWDGMRIAALPRGHCWMGGFLTRKIDESPQQRHYREILVRRHGEKRAGEILAFDRHNTIVYPNLFVNSRVAQIRVLQPVSVDCTEQHGYTFRLKGAPEEMFEATIRMVNTNNSPFVDRHLGRPRDLRAHPAVAGGRRARVVGPVAWHGSGRRAMPVGTERAADAQPAPRLGASTCMAELDLWYRVQAFLFPGGAIARRAPLRRMARALRPGRRVLGAQRLAAAKREGPCLAVLRDGAAASHAGRPAGERAFAARHAEVAGQPFPEQCHRRGWRAELTARAHLLVLASTAARSSAGSAGRSSWRLRPEGTSFRIAAKRVDLLNADQDSGHLRFTIPF